MGNTDTKHSITGLILAGGQASRMGGNDKGLLFLNEKRLIEHVINRLDSQVEQITISCNRNIATYESFGHPVITDSKTISKNKPEFNGPLAGILAGLESVNTTYTLIVPCDSPVIPLDLGQRLLNGLIQNNAEVAVPFDGIRRQPLFLLIKTELKDELRNYYLTGERSMKRWLEGKSLAEVNYSKERASFTNLNTPIELRTFSQTVTKDF
ncbi:MAG: molybdenum cofactor guanylyltransferase [Pseudomonadales bacterium]|nr:molybdenum cofactor guanylyltransferase [Pseudomonadales bacterium]